LVPSVSVANELAAQPSNTWSAFAVAVTVCFQKPSTFPSSTCIDLLRLIHVCHIVEQQHALLAHSSMSCHVLAVAPHCSTQDPGAELDPDLRGGDGLGLGVGLGIRDFRDLGS